MIEIDEEYPCIYRDTSGSKKCFCLYDGIPKSVQMDLCKSCTSRTDKIENIREGFLDKRFPCEYKMFLERQGASSCCGSNSLIPFCAIYRKPVNDAICGNCSSFKEKTNED